MCSGAAIGLTPAPPQILDRWASRRRFIAPWTTAFPAGNQSRINGKATTDNNQGAGCVPADAGGRKPSFAWPRN
jgi:hypothetical protein